MNLHAVGRKDTYEYAENYTKSYQVERKHEIR